MKYELYGNVASNNSGTVSSMERLYSSVFPSDCFLWNIEVPNAEFLDGLFSWVWRRENAQISQPK